MFYSLKDQENLKMHRKIYRCHFITKDDLEHVHCKLHLRVVGVVVTRKLSWLVTRKNVGVI